MSPPSRPETACWPPIAAVSRRSRSTWIRPRPARRAGRPRRRGAGDLLSRPRPHAGRRRCGPPRCQAPPKYARGDPQAAQRGPAARPRPDGHHRSGQGAGIAALQGATWPGRCGGRAADELWTWSSTRARPCAGGTSLSASCLATWSCVSARHRRLRRPLSHVARLRPDARRALFAGHLCMALELAGYARCSRASRASPSSRRRLGRAEPHRIGDGRSRADRLALAGTLGSPSGGSACRMGCARGCRQAHHGKPDVVLAIWDNGVKSAAGVPVHNDFNGVLSDGTPKVASSYDFNRMSADNDFPLADYDHGAVSRASPRLWRTTLRAPADTLSALPARRRTWR